MMDKKEWKRGDRPSYCKGIECEHFIFDSEDNESCGLEEKYCPYSYEKQEITSKDVGSISGIFGRKK